MSQTEKKETQVYTYKILGALLAYPEIELIGGLDDLILLLQNESRVPKNIEDNLIKLIQSMKEKELLTLQEEYVTLFDRNPSLCLYLFEHLHGDSRARGQAMVDLANTYQSRGLRLKTKELPDYLPVFLEFLSLLPMEESKPFLENFMKILIEIKKKLHENKSYYAVIFDAIEDLGS